MNETTTHIQGSEGGRARPSADPLMMRLLAALVSGSCCCPMDHGRRRRRVRSPAGESWGSMRL